MSNEKQTDDLEDKPYFINTAVTKEMFKKVKSEAHRREISRSDYIRGLIEKDLKLEVA